MRLSPHSYFGPDEAELLRDLHREAGTKRLLSAVNKLNAKRLPLRIAQHLGLGAPPSDWSNDGTGLFRSFNRWREQVGLDFVIESYPRGTYECSLTDEHRRERDG